MAESDINLRIKAISDEARQSLHDTASSMRDVAEQTQRTNSYLETLKEGFGRGSTFFEAAHLLEGGGPAIGAKLVSREIQEWAKRGAEAADKFREGKISVGEMANEAAKSIPIFGALVDAGENINEIFTGNQLALREANDELAKEVALYDRMVQLRRIEVEAMGDLRDRARELSLEYAKIGAGPVGKSVVEFQEQMGKAVAAESAAGAKQINEVLNPKGTKGYDELFKAHKDLEDQIKRTNIPLPGPRTSTGGVLSPAKVGAPVNQDQIDAAQKTVDGLKQQLGDVDRELRARRDAAAPLQEQAWKNTLTTARNQIADFAELGKEGAVKFWDEFKKTAREHSDLKQDLQDRLAEATGGALESHMAMIDRTRDRTNRSAQEKYGAAGSRDLIDINNQIAAADKLKATKDFIAQTEQAVHEQVDRRTEQAVQRRDEIERSAHESRMGFYRAEAESSNQITARLGKRNEILEEQKDKLRDIRALEDKGVSAADRLKLEAAKTDVRSDTAQQLKNLTAQKDPLRLTAMHDERGTSGIGDLLRARSENQSRPATKDDVAAATAKAIKDTADAVGSAIWDTFISKYPNIQAIVSATGNNISNFFRSPNT